MANDRDRKILEMIGRALKKNPNISNTELQKKANRIDKGVSELSPRTFNARYPLQVKRKLSGKKGGRKWVSKKNAERKIVKGRGKSTGKKGGRARVASPARSSWAEVAFQEKKRELVGALDSAFDEVMKSDAVSAVDQFLSKMNKAKKLF